MKALVLSMVRLAQHTAPSRLGRRPGSSAGDSAIGVPD
jgi:hypothetical protein